MSIIGSNILAGASGQAGYNINNSLRFRASASAYLSRTFTTPTNNKIFTLSSWVKRGALGASQFELFTAGTNGSNYVTFQFGADKLNFVSETPTLVMELRTTQVFRDSSSWYHIVLAVDTTQATSTNRVKIYVNGTQITSFSTATYPAQNLNLLMNSAVANYFGYNLSGGGYYDGYLTEAHFVDGQQLTPSSFGETSLTTGQWIPKAYSGSYGTNGFKLNFSDTSAATAAAIGKDSSGNGNNWTPSGISVTAGVTYDAMLDVPTNTSATVGNYPTLNPLIRPYSANTDIISAGNLKASSTSGPSGSQGATISFTSGKYYFEATATTVSGANKTWIGVCNNLTYYSLGTWASAFVRDFGYTYASDGKSYSAATPSGTTYGATYTSGDIIGVAIDADAGSITFYKNGTSQGTAFTGMSYTGGYVFGCTEDNSNVVDFNFGQRPFSYTPPTGFVRLNTYNLPTPTILQGNKYMDATLYTGTGASLSVTNAGAFKPDFVWVKGRSGATDHALYDSVRGTTKDLVSNSTAAETTQTTGLTAFGTGGFTVGALAKMNTSAATYVGWQWQAGQGSSSSNTSGTITSTVSASTTAGFSVFTYTGNATANATIGHGLGVAPKMFIVKCRSTTGEGLIYHVSTGKDGFMQLFNTDAFGSSANYWGSTGPTSTTIQINGGGGVNNSGTTYVVWCWAEIAGYSKAFSYTGNGSTDGSFVYTGFLPRFVLIKRTDTTGDWYMWDTARNTYDVITNTLLANSSAAETSATSIDALSNGFKLRNTTAGFNASGGTYIGMAWATNPFKNSNAF